MLTLQCRRGPPHGAWVPQNSPELAAYTLTCGGKAPMQPQDNILGMKEKVVGQRVSEGSHGFSREERSHTYALFPSLGRIGDHLPPELRAQCEAGVPPARAVSAESNRGPTGGPPVGRESLILGSSHRKAEDVLDWGTSTRQPGEQMWRTQEGEGPEGAREWAGARAPPEPGRAWTPLAAGK